MFKRAIITGIIMLLILSSIGGMASSMEEKNRRGFFKGNVFNNLRIMVEINEDYAVIRDAKNGETLVEKAYPIIEIKEGKEWRKISFEYKFMEIGEHRGWHTVAMGFAHSGKIAVRGFLEYYQRKKVGEGAPLYPLLLLYFNKSVEHRVVWRYEGIATNWFEVIDNGTGETRAPFKEGHARRVIYNGTIQGKMEFEEGQDIVLAWKNGVKEFGLNWEREKLRYKTLKFDVEDRVNMEIVEKKSDEKMLRSTDNLIFAYTPPMPSSGGSGSSVDSDGDGLSDSTEEAGWYIWICRYGMTWQYLWVHSDPYNPDSDGDGLTDGFEYFHNLNPEEADTDGDGLDDYEEINRYGTYGYIWDSDRDELSDGREVKVYGTDPHLENHRYAILLAPVRQAKEIAFKKSIESFREYLLDLRWKDENIWFLTAKDDDPNTNEWWIDGDATYTNLMNALNAISQKSTDNDLFVFIYADHGGGYLDHTSAGYPPGNYGGRRDGGSEDSNPNDEYRDGIGDDDNDPNTVGGNEYDEAICTLNSYWYDDEFATALENIRSKYKILIFDSCFSGGFIEDCSNDWSAENTLILTSAPENDFAWYKFYEYTLYLHYFIEGLTWNSSLGTHNPDTYYEVSNHNGIIDCEEAHAYADEYASEDTPCIWDSDPQTNICIWGA